MFRVMVALSPAPHIRYCSANFSSPQTKAASGSLEEPRNITFNKLHSVKE